MNMNMMMMMMTPRSIRIRPSLWWDRLVAGAMSAGSRAVKLFTVLVLLATIAEQFYISFYYMPFTSNPDHADHPGISQTKTPTKTPSEHDSSHYFHTNNKNNSSLHFGACLMIKEDNELLPEWLAYHYTVLPLRYIVIGSDVGNTQNPQEILSRYKNVHADLQYWVWNNASTFVNRHGPLKVVKNDRRKDQSSSMEENKIRQAHHAFVHRQKGFVTTCSEFLKKQGVQWTTYIDSDEFVVLNRLGSDDKDLIVADKGPNSIRNASYQARRDLDLDLTPGGAITTTATTTTVAEVLHKLRATGFLEAPCYTLPRLLVGSLETATCPAAAAVNELARRDYQYEEMSTLRFVQHATKGDFAASKFGKVVMDLSEMDEETVSDTVPRSIHRPYKSVCGPGVVPFANTVLYLNHYIGTWERYSSRQDGRRNRQEWEQRAYFDQGVSCDKDIHTWLPRFIAQMGSRRAQYLLGVVDDNVPGTFTTS
jgi:hypothetical protein